MVVNRISSARIEFVSVNLRCILFIDGMVMLIGVLGRLDCSSPSRWVA